MAFKIPLQTEVAAYMREKKGWPDEFCTHYAERFWNHYQASGWKLSSGNLIKDWKACFNSQWQIVKYKEDIELLNRCLSKQEKIAVRTMDKTNTAGYLDSILLDYKKNYDSLPDERYIAIYDYLKEKRAIKLTKAEIDDILQIAGNDPVKGKKFCVRTFFDKLINNNISFKTILHGN